MRFTSAFLVGAFAAMAAAQNAFTRTSYTGITAGSPTNITWQPTTQGTVTLKLVQGDPSALTTVATIAASIPNSGSYLWTPVTSLVAGSNYALEIIDDGNENIFNYTPQFAIASTNTVSSSAGASSSAASSAASSVSSSAATTAASSTSGSSSATAATTASSSKPASTTTGTSSLLTSTKTSSATSSASSSATSTSASKAAGATAGAKLGAGMLGLVGAVMIVL